MIHIQENITVDAASWDGRFKEEDTSIEVYTFYLVAQIFDGSTQLYKGDIRLFR